MSPGATVRRMFVLLSLLGAALPAAADDREIQRALIQRDQQSAEFARGASRQALENLNAQQLRDAGRPLSADPDLARQLQPYERGRMAQEREMLRAPAEEPGRPESEPRQSPLPLPGGPRHGVEPITAPSVGG